jgi:hypothetical protein
MGLEKHPWAIGSKRRVVAPLLAAFLLAAVAIGANASAALALSPAVETRPATAVAETTATLNGKVNPNGAETKIHFEYGTTTSYGSKTAEVSVGQGTTTLEKSQAVSGLSKNTPYHYRIVASNSFGSSYGADQTFTTTGPPQVLTFPPETEASGESATVKAYVDPNGQSTTYQFEYGTASGSYTSKAPIPAESAGSEYSGKLVTHKLTGLTRGTKYYYRVTATNAGGTAFGAEESFLSSKHPGLQVLPVSDISRSGATLNATIQPNESATKYWFEYGTAVPGEFKTPTKEIGGEVKSTSVSEPISKLKPNTTYVYRVVTENATGTHISQNLKFITLAPATLYLKGGAQLKAGAALKAFSSNFTFSSVSGSHSCSETGLSGQLQENPGAVQTVTTTTMHSWPSLRCPWKPSLTIEYSVPTVGVTLEYGINSSGEGVARTGKFALVQKIYYTEGFLIECEYNLALTGTYKTNQALEPTLSGKTETIKGGGEFCPPNESVTGKFAVTSGGTAVEAKP